MVALVLALSLAPRPVVKANLPVGQGVHTALTGQAHRLTLPNSTVPLLFTGPAGKSGPNVNPSQSPFKLDDPKVEAKLDALFDGKLAGLGGEDVLSRLPQKGVSLAQVGEALSKAEDVLSANENLEDLGLLKSHESADQWALLRLWHEAAATQPAPKTDASWAVPSLTGEAQGVVWHVHGVFHGRGVPGMAAKVTALAKQLEEKGLPLYTEELLGRFYGLTWGEEVRDRSDGRLVPQYVFNRSPSRLARFFGAAALKAWAAYFGAMALLAALLRRRDLSHWLRARRSALFGGYDLAALRRTELPMPLYSSLDPWVSERSELIARTAKLDARLNGKTQAHVLVGHKHAQEVLWWLTGGPRA